MTCTHHHANPPEGTEIYCVRCEHEKAYKQGFVDGEQAEADRQYVSNVLAGSGRKRHLKWAIVANDRFVVSRNGKLAWTHSAIEAQRWAGAINGARVVNGEEFLAHLNKPCPECSAINVHLEACQLGCAEQQELENALRPCADDWHREKGANADLVRCPNCGQSSI